MLNDNVFSLRENAANAIFHLTGKKVSVRRPQISFPIVKLKDNLIKYKGKLPKAGWMTSSSTFDYWFDRKRGLLRWDKDSIILYGPDLKPLASLKTNKMSHDFIMILKNQKRSQLVTSVSDEYMPNVAYVISLNAQGNKLWQYRPARSGIESIVPLYDKDGNTIGVMIGVGGSEGIVALNHEGKILWKIPNFHVLYEIKVSYYLPNRVAVCGGSIDIFDESGKLIISNSSREDEIYAHHIEIFRDKQNKMSIIATGSGEMSIPTIIRYDATLTPIWKASLPHTIQGLAMLDFRDKEKLFVVATDGGELFIFDQNGTLKYQDTLPGEKDDGYPVYGIKAGVIGDDKYAFSIGTLSGILIYEFIIEKRLN